MTLPNTLDALLATVPLSRLPRTGWVVAGVGPTESIAAHSHSVGLVILALGPRVGPPLDVDRAVSLAAVHDVPEALISDLPRTAARFLPTNAKRIAETAAADELLPPLSMLALQRYAEYAAAETREARFARLCDRLQMGIMLVANLRTGVRGLDDFVESMIELDCSEFPPCQELRAQIVDAATELGR